jgi:hypothetical protein
MTHTKDEALKLAIQSLESCSGVPHWPAICATIVTIKQALAAPTVQEPVGEVIGTNEYAGFGQIKHVKTIQWRGEPAPIGTKLYTTPPAQPAPVQEPFGYLEIEDIESHSEYPHNCRSINLWHEGGEGMVAIYTTPPAQPAPKVVDCHATGVCAQSGLRAEQPAPVQEPIGYLFQHEETGLTMVVDVQQVEWGFEKNNPRHQKIGPVYTTPLAQPAVPDAMTSADIQEHIEYVAGWNDCRQAMMEMMK